MGFTSIKFKIESFASHVQANSRTVYMQEKNIEIDAVNNT